MYLYIQVGEEIDTYIIIYKNFLYMMVLSSIYSLLGFTFDSDEG